MSKEDQPTSPKSGNCPADPIKKTTSECPTRHWIVVKVIRKPDKKQRHGWWPARRTEAYSSESFSAEITDGHKDGSLNSTGMVRFDNIPAGSCQFLFNKFFEEIDQFFKKQLQ